MGITDKIRQVKSKQGKSVKSTPASEGGLGLSPDQNSGSIDDDIRKAKENLLAEYWYDKYEKAASAIIKGEIRGDVADNFKKLQEKVDVINEDVALLEEEVSTDDPLTPLEQKFVTLDKLAEHYKLFLSRVQRQIATIGGGGIGDVVDDPSPQLGGNLDINGKNITGSGNIDITGTVDVTGVTTFEDDVTFTGATSNLTWDASANDLEFDDDSRLKFGDGDDFQIWHGGTHTFVKNNTGELRIRGDIISLERADDTEKYLEANVNEDVKLFYNGNEKFATTNTGATVTGALDVTTDITGLTLNADGDTSSGDDAAIGYTAAEGLILTGQGSTSDITFKNDADTTVFTIPTGTDDILFPDDAKILMGTGSDLEIFHDGSHSYVKDNGTGDLKLQASDDVVIEDTSGANAAVFNVDAGQELYWRGGTSAGKKFETTQAGATVTGDLTASGTIGATGDTAAGDDAAVGYTSGEGLILTGQGSTNDVTIKNDADTNVIAIPTGTSNVTIAGDLTINGDDLFMDTNTSGYILVADGTNYNPVAVSGDVTISNAGAVTIASTAVEGSMLNNNVISGQTALTSGLATTDELMVSDAGTLKRMDVSVLQTLTDGSATALAIALG